MSGCVQQKPVSAGGEVLEGGQPFVARAPVAARRQLQVYLRNTESASV